MLGLSFTYLFRQSGYHINCKQLFFVLSFNIWGYMYYLCLYFQHLSLTIKLLTLWHEELTMWKEEFKYLTCTISVQHVSSTSHRICQTTFIFSVYFILIYSAICTNIYEKVFLKRFVHIYNNWTLHKWKSQTEYLQFLVLFE